MSAALSSFTALIGTTSCAAQRPTIAPATAGSRDRGGAQSSALAERPAERTPPEAPELHAASQESSAPPELGPISSKATPKTERSWAACLETIRTKGVDPAREVATLANACATATQMKLVSKTITGKQSDADPPQSYPFQTEAKRCYRVYAQGDGHIENLNVAIEDSAGVAAGQDSPAGSTSVVLHDGAVCFKESDAATVVVSVGRGGGVYALQVWGD
jgi:hypothetical protein